MRHQIYRMIRDISGRMLFKNTTLDIEIVVIIDALNDCKQYQKVEAVVKYLCYKHFEIPLQ